MYNHIPLILFALGWTINRIQETPRNGDHAQSERKELFFTAIQLKGSRIGILTFNGRTKIEKVIRKGRSKTCCLSCKGWSRRRSRGIKCRRGRGVIRGGGRRSGCTKIRGNDLREEG